MQWDSGFKKKCYIYFCQKDDEKSEGIIKYRYTDGEDQQRNPKKHREGNIREEEREKNISLNNTIFVYTLYSSTFMSMNILQEELQKH